MLIELAKFWSVLTSEQYAHFQWLIKLNSPSLCSQVFVDFQGFTACRFITSWLISVYFWLILPEKGCRFSAWQENSYCLWNQRSADFHGFYRTQNFCIFIESSKFWSILAFEEFLRLDWIQYVLAFWLLKWMHDFGMLKNSHCLCNRRSAVFHGFYRVQNFCIFNECSSFFFCLNR